MNSILSPSRIILLTGLFLTLVTANINWGGNRWKSIIENDAQAYYAYLPAVFIYHDLNFGFFETVEKEYFPDTWFDYRNAIGNVKVNKYYCGTALAQLPFFLTVHMFCSGDGSNGWGKPYMIMISLAAIVWLLIGLFFLSKLLRLYNIHDAIISVVILLEVFGTHLFYYTIGEPGMSHVYSFAFIAMFLYFGKRLFIKPSEASTYILLALCLAFTIIIRPVNGLVVLSLPFLAGSSQALVKTTLDFLKKPSTIVLSAVIFLFVVCIQLIIYKIASGSFFIYTYANEGFNFFQPHFLAILFSYKKGLFLYTPLLLISLSGFYILWKKNRFELFSLLFFLIVLNFVLSSWWMWWYGGSFSSRVYVEFIPVFMVLLGIFINSIEKPAAKRLFITFALLVAMLCQIQTYQYRKGTIHWDSMTKELYWQRILEAGRLFR